MAKILYSPGYGAGWSTWNHEIPREFMTMDPTLISMAEAGATEEDVTRYIEDKFPDKYSYLGGWGDITVKEIPAGTMFRITEYDGSESVVMYDPKSYLIAI